MNYEAYVPGLELFGWSGLYIEASGDFPALAERYATRDDVLTVQAIVTPANVNGLFAAAVPSP